MKIYIFFPQLIKTNGVSWRDGLDCMLILQSSEFLKTLAKSSEFGSFVNYIIKSFDESNFLSVQRIKDIY